MERQCGCLLIQLLYISSVSGHLLADEMLKQCWLVVVNLTCVLSFLLQGPCHLELQRALDKIAKSQQKLGDKLTRFYLPNCDKHGLYKPKQVGVCSQVYVIAQLWDDC